MEASWGWVAYHYGRWIFDDELGWCWIPGEEWSPARAQWRRATSGADYVGWAPLPPDDVYVEYVDAPTYWVFVRGRDLIAQRLVSFMLPVARYDTFIRETVVVNRTVLVDFQHTQRSTKKKNPGASMPNREIAPLIVFELGLDRWLLDQGPIRPSKISGDMRSVTLLKPVDLISKGEPLLGYQLKARFGGTRRRLHCLPLSFEGAPTT